jgi:sugar lactone lactonase YvrE
MAHWSDGFGRLNRSRLHRSVLLLCGLAVAGCSQRLEPVFEQPRFPISWPAAAAEARIRYVGQLASSADLKPPRKAFQALGELLLGAKEPQTLYGPRAVLCNADGTRVWVADPGGRCLHRFDLESREYSKIERAGETHLLSPVGLCRGAEDSVFVCDSEDVAVHRISGSDGALLGSLRLPEEVQRPVALSYDPNSDELYVVDVGAHDIKVLGPQGDLLRIIGRRGRGAGEFNFPCDIADDGEVLWVADTGNQRVQGLARSGEVVAVFGQTGDAPGDLAMPKAIALDSDGHLYVVDARFENVQIFDRSGVLLLFFGQEGSGPGEFWLPGGIFIDQKDRVWVCDSYNGRVQVFDYLKRRVPPQGSDNRGAPRSRSREEEGGG